MKNNPFLIKIIDQGESSGNLARIYRSIASGGRAENHGFDPETVRKESQALYDVYYLNLFF